MNRMTAAQLRESYLQFFEKKGHKRITSDSLIPKSDPTVLFTGAGMMQFKANFLGTASDGLTRATTCQKCVRTVDIEQVGLTTRHCTFFEMLGNFSFGDYFKEEAIVWGWEYVTQVLGMPEDKLWATVYKNDDEAYRIWEKEVGVPVDHIRRLGEAENFWEVPNMPCGPCSEIHIDFGPGIGCGRGLDECGPQCSCDRFSELWNLVFTQFRREADGTLSNLPKPNIDTGMGLERVAAVLQGVKNVFETDQFRPIIEKACELTGAKYGVDPKTDISLRIIAEHARMSAFCIGDHIYPENVGRGYVLRRVMRRAIRHGHHLGVKGAFLGEMLERVGEVLGGVYPELINERKTIQRVAALEEENFTRTIERGMNKLEALIEEAKASGNKLLPGREIFVLYDTYGFPKDLAEEVLRDENLAYNTVEFESEMEDQRSRAQAAWKGDKAVAGLEVSADVVPNATEFTGYDEVESDAKVLAIYKDNAPVDSLNEGVSGILILDRTPFYAEAGGQVADPGVITQKDGSATFEVTAVRKNGRGVYLHEGTVKTGTFKLGAPVHAAIDAEKRARTVRNHTATHLLHAALRQRLGTHVKQAGSLVDWERLRFDFSHYEAISRDNLDAIERAVNEWVVENHAVLPKIMPLEEAKKTGAMALFDEKYGNEVRVVSIGGHLDSNNPEIVSREFCGGTHASRTGDIGLVRIVGESSISAGTRRIEAVTGLGAYEYTMEREKALALAASALRAAPTEVADRVEKLLEQNRKLEKELAALSAEKAKSAGGELANKAIDINGVKLIAEIIPIKDNAELNASLDTLKERVPSGVFFLAGVAGDRIALIAAVTPDLTKRFSAGKLIQEAAPLAGGKGGGKADRAQGGAKDVAKLGDVIAKVKELVAAG